MLEIKNCIGDVRNTEAEVIIHQVNCFTIGSGVAKAIIDKWPMVKEEHKKYCDSVQDKKLLIGTIQPVKVSNQKTIINMFAQFNFGYDGKRYTSYDALWDALEKTATYCAEKGIKTVALPYNMSCHRGGGNWSVVLAMVKAAFKDTDISIEVWKLEE